MAKKQLSSIGDGQVVGAARKTEGVVDNLVDHAQHLQAPAVAKYVHHLRREHPYESPAQIIERLEHRFLLAVTGSGGAVGAAAAFPGIGTVASFASLGAETVFFIEASALLSLAVAEVHGIPITDRERRKALVLTVALGESGLAVVRDSLGAKSGNLARAFGGVIPTPVLKTLNKRLVKTYFKKYTLQKLPLAFGKLLPAGFGAVIGGVGNRALGKIIVNNSHKVFGPAPMAWPAAGGPPHIVSGGAPQIVSGHDGPMSS
ncbi:hypothetical protein [Williamsia sp. 1135]|uniref:hypothetical protein n=1 Tax=Williamsia sp. 1135 TaxID=1889262 RepID=UPI000A11045C|nr:hypothetical protein [Williamsia sp. 1135]ORM26133.1 hypothetical protein BFL43_24415 [Williamsia sp. 1135]